GAARHAGAAGPAGRPLSGRDCAGGGNRGSAELLLARALDLEGTGRKPVALSPRKWTAVGDIEPDVDAHLHGLAGSSADYGQFDGDCADLGGEFFVWRPL